MKSVSVKYSGNLESKLPNEVYERFKADGFHPDWVKIVYSPETQVEIVDYYFVSQPNRTPNREQVEKALEGITVMDFRIRKIHDVERMIMGILVGGLEPA